MWRAIERAVYEGSAMTNEEPQPAVARPLTPPTQVELPSRTMPAPAPSWPSVLGIIAIVFGVFGTLTGAYGVLAPFLMRFMAQIAPAAGRAGLHVAQQWAAWGVANGALTGALALLLLAAGLGLLRRRRWACTASQVWAVLRIMLAGVQVGVAYFIQQDTLTAVSQQMPASMPSQQYVHSFAALGLVVSLLWYWALPVFLLIWLARGRVREHVAEWT